MITKALLRPVLLLLACAGLLAGCGGGGGGGAAEPPRTSDQTRITITAQSTTLSANGSFIAFQPGTDFATQIDVEVRNTSGAAVPDGTTVGLSVSNGAVGALSTPETLDQQSTSLQVVTVAGRASAVFHARAATGSTQVTASAQAPGAAQSSTASVTISVNDAVTPPRRVELTATKTRIPANIFGVPIFLGSPYIAEVTITYRDRFGVLGAPADGEVGVSVDPVTTAAFSTLDDPETDDINEFLTLVGNAPVSLAGGNGTIFVHSFDIPGAVRVSVSAQDADTGQVVDNTIELEIVEPASDGAPANVVLQFPTGLLYVNGSGGAAATQFEALVFDGAFEPVADPSDNNNVLLELTGDGAEGAFLSAVDVSGASVNGRAISIATTAGVTSATLRAGGGDGFLKVRATGDAADNNVDNGIQAPVVDVFDVEVTDGEPFAVSLSAFQIGPGGINPVNDGVRLVNADPANPFPVAGNNVYQLPVFAVVTDRRGNPPARPVSVQFGVIDTPVGGFPVSGPGSFLIAGGDGNPVEGGSLFTAPTGAFQTAGGGAGPGDTLVLFGRDAPGNDDLEGARQVSSIISETQLTVTRTFNGNDTTGSSRDSGPAIPYAIGRAQQGTIVSDAPTDENGLASTVLNFPVSAVGRSLIVHAQVVTGDDFRTLGDVSQGTFPAAGPLTLIASPDDIVANRSVAIQLCAVDGAGVPIPGIQPTFAFGGGGVGTVDGIADSGRVATPTGFDGCTTVQVTTTGGESQLVFEAGLVAAVVEIASGEDQTQIDVIPEAVIGNNVARDFDVRVSDAAGNGLPGLNLNVDCQSSQGAVSPVEPPAVTDADGRTTLTLSIAGLDALCPDETPGTATCTVDTTGGVENPEQIFITGREGFLLPDDPACGGTPEEFTVTIDFRGTPNVSPVTVFSDDGLIACDYDGNGSSGQCSVTYFEDDSVILELVGPGVTPPNNFDWRGACSDFGANTLRGELVVTSDQACIVRFLP